MRLVALLSALMLFSSAAIAQGLFMTEEQKRTATSPYATAASDCVAKQMGDDPRFPAFVREARTLDLVPEALAKCRPQLRKLQEVLDAYFWPGYGTEFIQGPYIADLPRAVMKRLEKKIAAVAANDAAEAAKRKSQQAAAQAEEATAAREFWDCISGKAKTLLPSGERAELVAEAALTLCGTPADRYVAAFVRANGAGLSGSELVDMRSGFRAGISRNAVSLVVIMKSNTASPVSTVKPVSAPQPVQKATALDTCIETVAASARPQLLELDKKLSAVLDLCRPEIESTARDLFAASKDESLDLSRQKAYMMAKDQASRALGN